MNNSNFKHVGSPAFKDAHMMLKLTMTDPAAVGILDCALALQPHVVERIVEEGGLYKLPAGDTRWWSLLSSLHTIGKRAMDGDAGEYPHYFRRWWGTFYKNMPEWDLADLTVFGSQTHESIFDGQRNINVEI